MTTRETRKHRRAAELALVSLTLLAASTAHAYIPYEPPAQTAPDATTGPMLPTNPGNRCAAFRNEGGRTRAQCSGSLMTCQVQAITPMGQVVTCSIDLPSHDEAEGAVTHSHTVIIANGVILFDSGRIAGILRVTVADPYVFVSGTMIGPTGAGGPPRVLFRTPEMGLRMDYAVFGAGSGGPPRLHTCLYEWDWNPTTLRYVRGAQNPGVTEDMCYGNLTEICEGLGVQINCE